MTERILGVRVGKTVFHTGDKVIKMFDEGYNKADILNEALNQSRLENTPLKLPKILEVTKIDGKWAIIQEYICGKPLTYFIQKEPENAADYLRDFVDLQIQMHTITPPLLNKYTDATTRKLSDCELLATVRYHLIGQLNEMPKGNSFCHGDYDLSNVIRTQDGEYYVLDFSHATTGNPLADVAKSYILLQLNKELEQPELYLDLYCQQAQVDKQLVYQWLSIVAASMLNTCKPEDKPFLYQFIKS